MGLHRPHAHEAGPAGGLVFQDGVGQLGVGGLFTESRRGSKYIHASSHLLKCSSPSLGGVFHLPRSGGT